MHLIQVINVGQIVGGTAACAWSVTRALPDVQHSLVSLSPISRETQTAFAPVPIRSLAGGNLSQFEAALCEQVRQIRDAGEQPQLLLHNTHARWQLARWPCPTLVYAHSHTSLVKAHQLVVCSHWLKKQARLAGTVLWQGVPDPHDIPPPVGSPITPPAGAFRVGRLCTPTVKKFPAELIPLYAHWAKQFPQIWWEFVGCPTLRQPALKEACRGHISFHPAGWSARHWLCEWDAWLYTQPAIHESFGRVLAEAMLAGTFPICDAQGGFCEQFPPLNDFPATARILRQRGQCHSPADFSDDLDWMITQPTPCRSLRQALQSHARQHFSLPAFATRLKNLLPPS